MMNKTFNWALSLVLASGVTLLSTGCQTSRSGRVYSRQEARAPMSVEWAVVEQVNTDITIEGTKTVIGAASGAIMGGVLGSTIGGGRGRRLATTAGALGGAGAGAAAEERLTQRPGVELTLALEDGGRLVIVQEADEVFNVGDRVRVITSADGTKRVRH